MTSSSSESEVESSTLKNKGKIVTMQQSQEEKKLTKLNWHNKT